MATAKKIGAAATATALKTARAEKAAAPSVLKGGLAAAPAMKPVAKPVKAVPAEKAEKPVTLIELDRRIFRIRVRGTSPLIVHAWSEKAIRMMEDKQQKKAVVAKEAKDPEVEFQGCFYKDDDGNYCFPARAFKAAMVSATTSIEDKKFPKTKIRQVVFVKGDLLKIIHKKEPDMRTDPVRLGGTTADIRYRPEFKEWEVDLDIEYNAAAVSQTQIINLLNLAGFAVGIGEWRPEKNGNFGRFEIVRGK